MYVEEAGVRWGGRNLFWERALRVKNWRNKKINSYFCRRLIANKFIAEQNVRFMIA